MIKEINQIVPETTHPEGTVPLLTGSGKPFDPDAAIQALDSLLEGDEAEQRETLESLKKGMDEHRIEGSKLFP